MCKLSCSNFDISMRVGCVYGGRREGGVFVVELLLYVGKGNVVSFSSCASASDVNRGVCGCDVESSLSLLLVVLLLVITLDDERRRLNSCFISIVYIAVCIYDFKETT